MFRRVLPETRGPVGPFEWETGRSDSKPRAEGICPEKKKAPELFGSEALKRTTPEGGRDCRAAGQAAATRTTSALRSGSAGEA